MFEDDEKVLITLRCVDVKNVIVGNRKDKCGRCKEDVWISPSSENMPFSSIICSRCLTETEVKEATIAPLSKDQISEIENVFIQTQRVNKRGNN
jgi:hypothetical protein